MYQFVNNLSYQAGAHAFKVGADFLYNDDRITFPRAVGGTYGFSSMASFLTGVYNNAGFTQTFGETEVSQTNPNLGVYAQDEWKVSPRLTLNAGLRYELQFLETIATDANNISPRLGVTWSPLDSGRMLVRGGVGLFYDRVPLRAVANALLSAGNTTDLTKLRQISVSLSPTQAGAPDVPEHPERLRAVGHAGQPDHHGPESAERLLAAGQRRDRAAGRRSRHARRGLSVRARAEPADVGEPERAGAACRREPTTAAAQTPTYANNNQFSAAGESSYHGLNVSFIQRPTRWGQYRISYTLSTSKNNVGEFFFSSPIDPFDLSKDWGRSDDDQRHRLVFHGTVHSSSDPATTVWQHISHGFELSGMVQTYSRLPFNVTSGVTTLHGTAGRPIVNGAFIERNAGIGSDFFSLNARVSRTFRLTGRLELQALAEGFNLTNRLNGLTRNTNFGPGAYPTNPLPAFGQITAVSEPRSFQFGLRASF